MCVQKVVVLPRAHTYKRLEARPEGRQGGDPGASDSAGVHVHIGQPSARGPAGVARPQVPPRRRVHLRKHG